MVEYWAVFSNNFPPKRLNSNSRLNAEDIRHLVEEKLPLDRASAKNLKLLA
jgi:hypothetical protein